LRGYVDFQNWRDHKPVSISFGALAKNKKHRQAIINRLVENKIETRVFSAGNLGLHPFWVEKYGRFDDDMSNYIHSCGFFVPNYPEMSNEDIDFICSVVRGDV
jgi:CDP-6-deoxy-D-xylo-4-hexulose-3-dehydrase